MSKFGCTEKCTNLIRQFHDGMTASVMDDGDTSNPFEVSNGVKQGCVLAPTLFSLMFSAMLSDAFRDSQSGIPIRYRTDGKLFNQRRLQAVTKVNDSLIRDLLFADDCALNAQSETAMQEAMDRFSSACDNFGLTISIKKTEVLFQPAPKEQFREPRITVKGQKLQSVDSFTYLGSTLTRSANVDTEVANRIAKASSAFGRLRNNVWERKGIKLATKLKVFKAVVITTLLYGCETWTLYRRHERLMHQFHLRSLRSIMSIRWQDKIPDTEVLKRADSPHITTIMRKAQLRWAGHVTRMPDSRIPKQLFYGELHQGKRTVGGQRKRYKDSLKASLKEFSIPIQNWEALALNRSQWRSHISQGAAFADSVKTCSAEAKRAAKKTRQASAIDSSAPLHPCPVCGRDFRARIGLTSHLRTHRNNSTNN